MRDQELERVKRRVFAPREELNRMLVSRGTAAITTGTTFESLLRRPQISYQDLAQWDGEAPSLPSDVIEQVEVEVKYEGYIRKQLAQVEQMRRLESRALPETLDYTQVSGLRLEAREKLGRVHPLSLGQASRISGVSPADISVLLIYLESKRREEKEK